MASENEIIRVGKELDKVVQQDPLVSVSRFRYFIVVTRVSIVHSNCCACNGLLLSLDNDIL